MKDILENIFNGGRLSRDAAREVLTGIAGNRYPGCQVASFLTAFRMRGTEVDELAGFCDAMLDLCRPVDLSEFQPIDLCGTGGDGKSTFNVSTLSAFIVAASGVKVAKHGNYAVSSKCGSSDVLAQIGVKFTDDGDTLKRQLERAGICFLHAPLFHPAMKNVAPVRKEMGVKTFFNLLGPLVNPCRPAGQLIGVYDFALLRLFSCLAGTLNRNLTIVHSMDGYDEISLTSSFKVVSASEENVYEPEELGFKRVLPDQISSGVSVEENAKLFIEILKGGGSEAQKAVVTANSGFALYAAGAGQGQKPELSACFQTARGALDSGRGYLTLQTLLEVN